MRHRRFARVSLVGVLAVVAASLAGCGSPSEDEFSNSAVAASAKKAGTVNGLCPVMKKPVVASADLVTVYKGEKIGFCCPPCKPKFEADPEKYMEAMRKDPDRFGYHH
jgi:YHS domain-containing protein